MNIEFRNVPGIPALAWCLQLRYGRSEAIAYMGDSVAWNKKGAVEGAWAGFFEDMDFPVSTTFTGSGVRVYEDHIVLSTPTHTLAPVYSIKRGRDYWASNSLATLLAVSGHGLDYAYPYYDADMMSVIFGIDDYVRTVPLANGGRIRLDYLANIIVDKQCAPRVERKALMNQFVGYDDYFSFVAREVMSVANNAKDSNRHKAYDIMATLSTGYDSPACAVFGQMAGAVSALTIAEAREGFEERNDSGAEIGRYLGFTEVHELTRVQALSSVHPDAELEIVSTGYGGDDRVLIGAEALLQGRLLLTGYHGDKVWSTEAKLANRKVRRGDPSGGSLLEFRLRADFLNLPVPFIGCVAHPDLQRISVSEEMAPWRLNTAYDRPIPRRIVEQAGVPRGAFGQAKKAIAQPYQDTDTKSLSLDNTLSPELVARFRAFLTSGTSNCEKERYMDEFLRRLSRSYKVNKLATRLGLIRQLIQMRWRYRKPISEHDFITAWAANSLSRQYRERLSAAKE